MMAVSEDLLGRSLHSRVSGPNVYNAHVGIFWYRRVKQVAQTIPPHPVLNMESTREGCQLG